MPERHEQVDLRPYILAACFAWGVIGGFLFYTLHDTPVNTDDLRGDRNEEEGLEDGTALLNRNGDTPEANIQLPKREWEAPPEFPEPDHDALAEEMDGTGSVDLPEDVPDNPDLALSPTWGLTGLTSAPPRPARRRTEPETTENASTPKADWSHWDDPDMVF